MYIGGMFQRSANKLGPLVCRDAYEQLDLPHLGQSAGGCVHGKRMGVVNRSITTADHGRLVVDCR